jgi:hypothetical protein
MHRFAQLWMIVTHPSLRLDRHASRTAVCQRATKNRARSSEPSLPVPLPEVDFGWVTFGFAVRPGQQGRGATRRCPPGPATRGCRRSRWPRYGPPRFGVLVADDSMDPDRGFEARTQVRGPRPQTQAVRHVHEVHGDVVRVCHRRLPSVPLTATGPAPCPGCRPASPAVAYRRTRQPSRPDNVEPEAPPASQPDATQVPEPPSPTYRTRVPQLSPSYRSHLESTSRTSLAAVADRDLGESWALRRRLTFT